MTLLNSKRELIPIVAKQVNTSWKRLARGLNLTPAEIDNIQEEEKDDHERCCKVLDTWCQRNGSEAKIKKTYEDLDRCRTSYCEQRHHEVLGSFRS